MADAYYLTADDVAYQREVNSRVMEEAHHTETPGQLAAPGRPAGGVWSPVVVKNYHDGPISAPWAVLFGEVRIVYRGVMSYTVYPLLLPASAMNLSAVYIYAVDTNWLELRWSATKVTPDEADPIRYVGKITPDSETGTMTFSELPAGVVTLPGGPTDIVRNIAMRTEYTSDLLSALTPYLAAHLMLLRAKIPVPGKPDVIEIDADLNLADYEELDEFILVADDGGTLEAITELDEIGNRSTIRIIAKISEPTGLGFRFIAYQDPLYTVMQSSRQQVGGTIRQYYMEPDGTIADSTTTISPEEYESPVGVYWYVDYSASSNSISGSAHIYTADDPPDPPGSGIIRFAYLVGRITPAPRSICITR